MKIRMLVVSVIGLSLICPTWADDLPRMGYSERAPAGDLSAKGYRWVVVNGPYACATEQDLRKITSNRTDLAELQMVEDGGAYYLIPGTLVPVIRDDRANGMSEILLTGITKPLWTYSKFLTARPIHGFFQPINGPSSGTYSKFLTARPIRDIYGIAETSDTGVRIDPREPAVAGSALNERSRGGTP
jgi:hypothetical protein